jgi:hypothetical protein
VLVPSAGSVISAEENVVGTLRNYVMSDWKTVSVSIACSNTGVGGSVVLQEGMDQGQGVALSTPASITLVNGVVGSSFGNTVNGRYFILDFSGATLPATGKLTIKIIGKRN